MTCSIDVVAKLQESVELPEPMMLFGVGLHEALSALRLTTPENPFSAVTVRLDAPEEPTLTLTFVGFPAIAKSWTLYVTVTAWEIEALVPVTPTWKVPTDVKVHDSVELPDPVTLVGLAAQDVLLVAKLTIPAKPFCAEILIVDVPAFPALTVTVVGARLIVKSWIVKVTVAECDKPPLVPVAVT